MQIKIDIQSCKDCRHIDHSGAYTPGGAKLICVHDGACSKRNKAYGRYDWHQRLLSNDGTIPHWCPLKRGSKY